MMFLSELLMRRTISNSGEHLDANTLAAFDEGAFGTRERKAVFAHLAECDTCREWLTAHCELRDFAWNTAETRKRRAFRFISTDFFQVKTVAATIACVVLLFAAISPHLLYMKSPARLASETPLEFPAGRRRLARSGMRSPVVTTIAARASSGAHLEQPRSKPAWQGSHLALWFQPALLSDISNFDDRRPRLPGPWGQARLARNLNFAATFSIGEGTLPSLNQIAVQTRLGERWITLDRFGEVAWERF